MKVNNISRYIIGAALILLVPLLAMFFTDEVKWSWFDFAVIGLLLIGTGITFELVKNRLNGRYRGLIAVVLLAALFLVWAELAVGIFESPLAGN